MARLEEPKQLARWWEVFDPGDYVAEQPKRVVGRYATEAEAKQLVAAYGEGLEIEEHALDVLEAPVANGQQLWHVEMFLASGHLRESCLEYWSEDVVVGVVEVEVKWNTKPQVIFVANIWAHTPGGAQIICERMRREWIEQHGDHSEAEAERLAEKRRGLEVEQHVYVVPEDTNGSSESEQERSRRLFIQGSYAAYTGKAKDTSDQLTLEKIEAYVRLGIPRDIANQYKPGTDFHAENAKRWGCTQAQAKHRALMESYGREADRGNVDQG